MAITGNIEINKKIFDALRTVIEIPDGVQSLKLSLAMDSIPEMSIDYFPTLLKEKEKEKERAE